MLYIYIYIYKYIYMYIYIYIYITHAHTQARKQTYMHTYMRTYIHTYVPTYTHTCIHTYVLDFQKWCKNGAEYCWVLLSIAGSSNTPAPQGRVGQWTLDPGSHRFSYDYVKEGLKFCIFTYDYVREWLIFIKMLLILHCKNQCYVIWTSTPPTRNHSFFYKC